VKYHFRNEVFDLSFLRLNFERKCYETSKSRSDCFLFYICSEQKKIPRFISPPFFAAPGSKLTESRGKGIFVKYAIMIHSGGFFLKGNTITDFVIYFRFESNLLSINKKCRKKCSWSIRLKIDFFNRKALM
jgi:hypothetical protein